MKKITHKVVMLPTEKVSKLRLDNLNNISFEPHIKGLLYNKLQHVYQHLYIISNEEIKESDWYYCNNADSIAQAAFNFSKFPNQKAKVKIIATTDKSLTTGECEEADDCHNYPAECNPCKRLKQLPQIPESFVKAYAEQVGIDEVQLEYTYREEEKDIDIGRTSESYAVIELKLNENNTVVIYQIKHSSRKDVLNEVYNKWLRNVDAQFANWLEEEIGKES